MHFNQYAGQYLTDIVASITGTTPVITNNAEYVACFDALKKFYTSETDFYNEVYKTMTNKISKVILANRDNVDDGYKWLEITDERFGGMMEKRHIFDRPIETQFSPDVQNLMDEGDDVLLPWKKKDPIYLITGAWGSDVWEDCISLFKHSLDDAMQNPNELERLYNDTMAQWRGNWENHFTAQKRSLLNTAIVSTATAGEPYGKVYNLLSIYNEEHGYSGDKEITPENWNQAGFIEYFMPWARSFIARVSKDMTKYSERHAYPLQTIFRGNQYTFKKKTPVKNQVAVFNEGFYRYMTNIAPVVDMHNPSMQAELPEMHTVESWCGTGNDMNFNNALSVTSSDFYYFDESTMIDGEVGYDTSGINVDGVLGCIYDEDALGIRVAYESEGQSPYNARTEMTTYWLHKKTMPYFDMFEKMVIFKLA